MKSGWITHFSDRKAYLLVAVLLRLRARLLLRQGYVVAECDGQGRERKGYWEFELPLEITDGTSHGGFVSSKKLPRIRITPNFTTEAGKNPLVKSLTRYIFRRLKGINQQSHSDKAREIRGKEREDRKIFVPSSSREKNFHNKRKHDAAGEIDEKRKRGFLALP